MVRDSTPILPPTVATSLKGSTAIPPEAAEDFAIIENRGM
jgi:hypothetical protein